MDTVQNIGSVIVGANNSQQQDTGTHTVTDVDVDNFYAANGAHHHVIPGGNGSSSRLVKLTGRKEFLSRPNWLFGHNENVLFCTALNSLRFRDQNNVPRKFIEEWLSDRMVNMQTEWGSGHRFLTETIADLKRDDDKFRQKKLRVWRIRQKGFYSGRQQNLRAAERAHAANPNPVTEKELEEARREAAVPMEKLTPPEPTSTEVALEELQTKIIRRLQGQTDRLEMAEYLAHKPYEEPNRAYFEQLQAEVLQAINEKHDEIAEERDKVEAKSKQSRKRRRNQVSNGMTMSGSATRVRFTNREIAMLIHWIYTWPKEEWSSRILEFYTRKGWSRSAEHVRDKLRDLVNRSRDLKGGGLSSIKARGTHSYFMKQNEPQEVSQLTMNDLQDFKYPSGPLAYTAEGRYFDEERSAWTDGPLPADYVQRYHDEIDRLRAVVKAKMVRNSIEKDQLFELDFAEQIQEQYQQLRDQKEQVGTKQDQEDGRGAQHESVYDIRLISQSPAVASLLQNASFSEDELAMVKNLQESNNNSQLFWTQNDKQTRDKDANEDIAALASAALKPDAEQFLHLETDEPKAKSQKTS